MDGLVSMPPLLEARLLRLLEGKGLGWHFELDYLLSPLEDFLMDSHPLSCIALFLLLINYNQTPYLGWIEGRCQPWVGTFH